MTAEEKIKQIEGLLRVTIPVETLPVLIAAIVFPEIMTRELIESHFENAGA